MLTALTIALTTAVVLVLPLAAIIGLMVATDAVQRRRRRTIVRQVDLTDAIHRELGAIVSPVVESRRRGRWTVRLAPPPDRLVTAGRLAAIAHRILAAEGRRDHVEVEVVTP